jgi:hypothetical protein
MTPQKLYRFGLNEIPSIDINCKTCHSVIRITIPHNNLAPNLNCAGCGTVFWYEGNTIYPLMQGLLRTLGGYIEREADQKFTVGFSLVYPFSSEKD